MADENKNIEEEATNDTGKKGGSGNKPKSGAKKGRSRSRSQSSSRRSSNPSTQSSSSSDPSIPEPPENPDAFEAYKYTLQTTKIPEAESQVEIYEQDFDMKKEIRRNQTAFLLGSEDFQREYLAINFNISSIMGQDAKEVKANIAGRAAEGEKPAVAGFVQMNADLKAKLVAARNAIIAAKNKLGKVEQEARKINDARDDSKYGSEMKILRRGITDSGGKKDIDEAIQDLVAQSDDSHNLSDDAREKEIIVEGIHAYIDVDSLLLHANKIETNVNAFKTDVDGNITFANTEVGDARTMLATRLAELSGTANGQDRAQLHLASLEETVENVSDVTRPEEDIQEILAQVEDTVDSGADDDDED